MPTIPGAEERGESQHGWLQSHHTFSFADDDGPAHRGYSALRVINDDAVAPGAGFAPPSHRDMEIISYVLEGGLEHKDSLGNGSVVRPGEVQRMTAGAGITHSEYHAARDEPLRCCNYGFCEARDLAPGCEQRRYSPDELAGGLRLVAARDGRDGAVTLHQNALIYATRLAEKQAVSHRPPPGRRTYIFVARGDLRVNGEALAAGDGAAIEAEEEIRVQGAPAGEALLFRPARRTL